MSVVFREARREEVAIVLEMMADDILGAEREKGELDVALAAFDAMAGESNNWLMVGEEDGAIVASYQLSILSSLSLNGARRAQVESVRVAASRRGQGIGALMMADAEARARAAGCRLVQLTTNARRKDAYRFYEREGYVASHVGFKKMLG